MLEVLSAGVNRGLVYREGASLRFSVVDRRIIAPVDEAPGRLVMLGRSAADARAFDEAVAVIVTRRAIHRGMTGVIAADVASMTGLSPDAVTTLSSENGGGSLCACAEQSPTRISTPS